MAQAWRASSTFQRCSVTVRAPFRSQERHSVTSRRLPRIAPAHGPATIAPPRRSRPARPRRKHPMSAPDQPASGQTWFTEQHARSGSSFGLRVSQRLHAEQTPFQSIEIYDTTDWGKLMVIDGCTMVSTRDNFLYHEMMSHPALFTHARAKRVVIIGGGDCGTLREVLKHEEVEHAVQVEIDERVTRLAEQYFPELCESNNDPRAQLLFVDGIKYMAECDPESVDLVIVDSTDPVGPAEGLFNADFYATCQRALRPSGILV